MRLQRKKTVILLVCILAAAVLLRAPARHLSFSIRLALSMQKLARGAENRNLSVIETTVFRRNGTQEREAVCYRPAKSTATAAVVLVPGISELGYHHPMLVALARLLADKGLFVITPDIRELREFRISVQPIDEILFWYNQAPSLQGAERVKTIGVSGISYCGTLALMAAARPEIRDKVGFVVAIGSYCNLARCAKGWFAAGSPAVENNPYPTRFYAKWIIMLAALDMVASPDDRTFLNDALHNLLLGKTVAPAGSSLSVEGMRWYRLATMPAGRSDEDLSSKIEEHLAARVYAQLDPKDAATQLRCPVFLLHGAYDDLIPAEESVELHERIQHSYLLISPFMTHTHPSGTSLSPWQKAGAVFDTLVFCSRLSQAIS